MSYELCQGQRKDYKELADTKLLQAKRSSKHDTDKLFAVEIVEEEENRVKIHYTGYSSKHDEWRDKEDIVEPTVASSEAGRYKLLDIHEILAYAIKSSLVSGRDGDPAARVEVPFDRLIFQGGLKLAGKLVKVVRGEEHYGITQHKDLTPYLGEKWLIRGINAHLDFCAVLAETVTYYLHKKAPINDFLSSETISGGYVLIFKFVRFDGVKDQLATFNVTV